MLVLRNAALAMLLAAAIVALASAGLYFTSAPPIVSLLVEPVSLLLMPGLIVALVVAGRGDFTAQAVVLWSLLLYTIVFSFALRWWRVARTRRSFR